MTTLQEALDEAYATAPAAQIVYHTLEFRHPSFTTPLRVVQGYDDLVATMESDAPVDAGATVTFVAYDFSVTLPDVSPDGTPELAIKIANVSQEIEAAIEGATLSLTPVEVTYRAYLESDLSAPANDPTLDLTLSSVSADMMTITARARLFDGQNVKFPVDTYTASRFPGLAT